MTKDFPEPLPIKMKKPFEAEANKIYSRKEDMSPDGFLDILIEPDGDIIVIIRKGEGKDFRTSEVQFCDPGSGGGRSSKTRYALFKLIEAMEEDSKENL